MVLSIACCCRTEDWSSILFSSKVTQKGQEHIQDDSLSNILNRFMQGNDLGQLTLDYDKTHSPCHY